MDIDIVAAPEVIMSNRSIALTPTASRSLTAAPSAPAPQYSHIFPITATSALWTHPNLRPSVTPTSGNPSTEKGAYTRANSVKSSARLGSRVSHRPSATGLPSISGPPDIRTSSISMSRPPKPSATARGLIHPVKVNFSDDALFNKNYLDNISIGDSVLFRFNGKFNLYNTTLEHPCAIKNKVQRDVLDPVYKFPVVTTDPVWFFACPADDGCYCDRETHFALNAGHLREEFFSNAAETIVVMKTTTPQEDMRTVYSTTWVTAS